MGGIHEGRQGYARARGARTAARQIRFWARWQDSRGLGVVMVDIGQRCSLAISVAILALVTSCGVPTPVVIHNGTSEIFKLAGCAGERSLERMISPGGAFTFTEELGERLMPDDPGFACLLITSHGDLLCLQIPTDQGDKMRYEVTEAVPTSSFLNCVENSGPHL